MKIFSPYLVSIIAAWVVAQLLKVVIKLVTSGKLKADLLYSSGGMPSSHSASVVALATVIYCVEGGDSAIFGLSVLFAAIVMYDAVMVRRSSGEQGVAIKSLIKEQKSNMKLGRIAKGHTPIEVLAGAILGLFMGILVFFVTK